MRTVASGNIRLERSTSSSARATREGVVRSMGGGMVVQGCCLAKEHRRPSARGLRLGAPPSCVFARAARTKRATRCGRPENPAIPDIDGTIALAVSKGATSVELYQDYKGFPELDNAKLKHIAKELEKNAGRIKD